MNDKLIISLALISTFLSLGFLGRYLYLDYKSKQEKSFLIIGLGLLAFWFFGGSTFLIVAIVLFALFFLKGCL
jgi:hypothetical protein